MSTAHITWDPIAEALCYNVYQVTDVDNPYVGAALVGDCIHATELDIPRQWFVRAVTDCGEGAVSAVVGVDCLDCPECPECPEVPTCDAEFFRITGDSPLFESVLSDFLNGGDPMNYIQKTLTLQKGHCVGVIARNAPADSDTKVLLGLHGFATGGTPTTLTDSARDWPAEFWNRFNADADNLFILSGTGAGTSHSVRTNSADTITLLNEGAFGFTPDATTEYLLLVPLAPGDQSSDLTSDSDSGCCFVTPCDGEYYLRLFNDFGGSSSIVSRGVWGVEQDTDELGAMLCAGVLIGFAIDTTRNKLFMADYDRETFLPFISRWDIATGVQESRVTVDPAVTGQLDTNALCYAPTTDKLYWVGRFPAKLFEINPTTLAVTNTLSLGSLYAGFNGATNATYYPVPASNGKLVLTGYFVAGKIGVINLDTFTIDGYVAGTKYAAAYSPIDNRIWAFTAANAGIAIIDPVGLTIDTATMPTYKPSSYQAVYSPVTEKMYLGNGTNSDFEGIFEIDPTDYSSVDIPNLVTLTGLALAVDANGKVWMNGGYQDAEMEEIVDLDPQTHVTSVVRKSAYDIRFMQTAPDGIVCVVAFGTNAVHRFTP